MWHDFLRISDGLFSIVDSAVTDIVSLIILSIDVWLELILIKDKWHWLKTHLVWIQNVSTWSVTAPWYTASGLFILIHELHVPPNKGLFNLPWHRLPKLPLWGEYWKCLMNSVTITFTRHESNGPFMGRS